MLTRILTKTFNSVRISKAYYPKFFFSTSTPPAKPPGNTGEKEVSDKDKASAPKEYVNLTFVNKDKSTTTIKAEIGKNILDLARANGLEVEGACEGSCACTTCHVVFEQKLYDKLPPASLTEEDLLDLAFALTSTSRLGCQVKVSKEFEGAKITLPRATRNMYVDGAKPKH